MKKTEVLKASYVYVYIICMLSRARSTATVATGVKRCGRWGALTGVLTQI